MSTATIAPLEVGVCSWSLRNSDWPSLKRLPETLQLRLLHLGLVEAVELAADKQAAWVQQARNSGLLFSAAMIGFPGENYHSLATIKATGGFVPDAEFETRLKRVVAAGRIARQLGISILTTHAGFLPPAAERANFLKMVKRLQRVIDALAESSVTLLFETGQEKPTDLAAFLAALGRANVGINFDPANLILYGAGEPAAAVEILGPWIRQMHAKDARRSVASSGDQWRVQECVLGEGDAQLPQVLAGLWQRGYRGPVIIEWEGGADQLASLRRGAEFLRGIIRNLPRTPHEGAAKPA